MPLDCFESNLAFASAYCTTKTAWQLPVPLTVQQFLWASHFVLRMLFVDLSLPKIQQFLISLADGISSSDSSSDSS